MTYLDDICEEIKAYKVEFIVRLGWRDDTTVRYFDSKDAAFAHWKRELFSDSGRGYPGSITVYDQSNGSAILKQVWS